MCPLTTPKAKRVSEFHNFPGFTSLTSSLENQLTLVDPRARSPIIPHLLKVEAFSPHQRKKRQEETTNALSPSSLGHRLSPPLDGIPKY